MNGEAPTRSRWTGVAAVSRAAAPAPRSARLRGRCALSVALPLAVAAYLIAVRTSGGQRWENAVLLSGGGGRLGPTAAVEHALGTLTAGSLGVAVVAVVTVGVIRRRYLLAAVAGGSVVATALAARILKGTLLTRPLLDIGHGAPVHNSLPSGHSAIAMSVAAAALLVTPAGRWRPLVGGPVLAWAVAMGACTVVAGWHRPSDVVTGNLLALGTAALAVLLLGVAGHVRAARPREDGRRRVLVVPLAVLAAVGAGAALLQAGVPGLVSTYHGGLGLACASGASTGLALLALTRGLSFGAGDG
ncbi:phosphatase PAP2 family protein [Streptomyces sp. NPDC098789]|uniref:phosphatase PAP2 family protein n=1 Tax=Streptomyces sp. NPDC098789 TaxID=3366098 RepID=UPI0038056AED